MGKGGTVVPVGAGLDEVVGSGVGVAVGWGVGDAFGCPWKKMVAPTAATTMTAMKVIARMIVRVFATFSLSFQVRWIIHPTPRHIKVSVKMNPQPNAKRHQTCVAARTTFKKSQAYVLVDLIKMKQKPTPPLLKYLEDRGITLQDLIDTALEFYVPHPGVETKAKAAKILTEEFFDALSDVNVATLEVAAFQTQQEAEAGRIPGLTKERFQGRPGLVADEMIGMAIADYLAGTKGIFEFTRFDQAKPGILKRLGALSNDAIGGLVAGVSSNMYTRAYREASK